MEGIVGLILAEDAVVLTVAGAPVSVDKVSSPPSVPVSVGFATTEAVLSELLESALATSSSRLYSRAIVVPAKTEVERMTEGFMMKLKMMY